MSCPMLALKICADELNKIINSSSTEYVRIFTTSCRMELPIEFVYSMHIKFHLKKSSFFTTYTYIISISSRKHKINVKQN